MIPFAVLLTAVFAFLASLHVYWGFGGRWGADAVIPTQPDGRPIFKPGWVACAIAAIGLGAIGHVCLAHVGLAPWPFAPFTTRLALLGVAGVFAARTAGDFRFFGLFRKVRGTGFARWDHVLFTPLSAALAAALALFALGTR